MKRLLLSLTLIAFSTYTFGQCVDDYDWSGQEYGVSPDPEEGETFEDGVLDIPYSETVYILVPDNAGAILEGQSAPIDSVELVSLVISQNGNTYTQEEFGVSLTCNNGGTSPNECTFMGGQSGCGLLSGTPLIAGEFSVTLEAIVYGTIEIQGNEVTIPLDFDYDGYTITILEEVSVNELQEPIQDVVLSPNPITTKGLVQFTTPNAGNVSFKVYNLLGEEQKNEVIKSQQGLNKIIINTSDYESGVYLYHLEMNGTKVTKRFVINK